MKKILSFILVLTIFFSFNNLNYLNVEAQDSIQEHYEVNGKGYDTNKYIVDGEIYLTVTSCDNPDEILNINLSNVERMLSANDNDSDSNASIVEYPDYLLTSSKASYANSSIRYGKKVYEKMENKYYYCYGCNSTTDYLKIGCNYNYRINLTKLNSTRKNNVNKYIGYIDDCNDDYKDAVAAVGAEAVSTIIMAGGGAVLLAALAPEALIVAVLAAGFTGTLAGATTAVTKLISASGKLNKASDMYETIKLYGTKL